MINFPLSIAPWGSFDAITDSSGRMICSIEWILREDAEALVQYCNAYYNLNHQLDTLKQSEEWKE